MPKSPTLKRKRRNGGASPTKVPPPALVFNEGPGQNMQLMQLMYVFKEYFSSNKKEEGEGGPLLSDRTVKKRA